MNHITETSPQIHCGLVRRMAVIFYDSLLLFAVLFAATAILLPITDGEAIHSDNLLYFFYLSVWGFLFFGWQWTHGGQTLGMRAWKVIVLDNNNNPITWMQAAKRYFLAMVSWLLIGMGFVWAIFDPERLTFHDRYSGTRLFKLKATK